VARGAAFALLSLIFAGSSLHAQARPPVVPPIPEQERFVPRTDLTVTLRLDSDRVQIDEPPRVYAVFKNVGTKRLLIRKPQNDDIHPNPVVSVYDNSGDKLFDTISSMCLCTTSLGRVRDLLVLEPQQEYEAEISVPAVALPGSQSWEAIVQAAGLPPGDYVLHAVYGNAPDSLSPVYDVYESGAEHAWEGRIETPPARFSVVPPSDARVQELIAAIDGNEDASGAIRIVGLARASQAADAHVRRLQRRPPGTAGVSWQSSLQALSALASIGDSEANNRLLAWIDTLTPQERSRQISGLWVTDALKSLMHATSGCNGKTLASWYGVEGIREFVAKCPQLAAEARAAIQAPYDPDRQGGAWDAKGAAVGLLGNLGDPADVPLLLAVARGEAPALERGPRGNPVPSESLMSHAVSFVRQIASRHVERVLAGISADRLPDGVSRNELLTQVRAGVDRLPPERVRILGPELMTASPQAVMDLALTLRYVETPPPAAPEAVEAALSRTPGEVTKETFREPAIVDSVLSADSDALERAVEAIARFGTAALFVPLRNALVLRPWDTAWEVDHALRELTFTSYGDSFPAIADPLEWDSWWRRNREMTRRQWAEEAFWVAKSNPVASDDLPAVKAFEYLRRLPNPPRGLFDKAIRSRLWDVRVSAATAIAETDKIRAMGLLLRELQNRSLGACRTAGEKLEMVANIQHRFDCGNPAERTRAIDFWAQTIAKQATH
jgi:hypothetical protein